MRETVRPPDCASRARASGLSSPSASISSAPRSITSAASRPSTACTKALLTRPRLRSGPRYHIGNGAASITWVSEFTAASVCRSRSASFARKSSVPRGSPAGPVPPRTSNVRRPSLVPTLSDTGAADARAVSTVARRAARSSAAIPPPSRVSSSKFVIGASSPSSRTSRSSASIFPSGQRTIGLAGVTSSKRALARAISSTCCARLKRRAAMIAIVAASPSHSSASAPTARLPTLNAPMVAREPPARQS